MDRPTVSVVIPLYNQGERVSRAVSSVLTQTAAPAEVIVVDDGSSDGGGERVRREFPRIQVIRQDNHGEGAARNTGVHAARSEWIAFLDSDDLWMPDHLSELQRLIAAVPDVPLVSTGFREWIEGTSAPVLRGHGEIVVSNFLELDEGPIRWIAPSSAAVRRDMLVSIGGFGSERVGCDSHLWCRLAEYGDFAFSNRETVLYIRGTGGVMESRLAESFRRPKDRDKAVQDALGPAYATIVTNLRRMDGGDARPRLIRFHDEWVFLAARGEIVEGRGDVARLVLQRLQGRAKLRCSLYHGASFIPPRFVRGLARMKSHGTGLRGRGGNRLAP